MIGWEDLAKELGYADEVTMWKDRYEAQKVSITVLAANLGVSRNAVRSALERCNIPIRTRGGANNCKFAITDALVEEVKKDGIKSVAERLGVSYSTLYKRIYGASVEEVDGEEPPQEGVTP